ncbi:MAG: DnaJ C-terminal domain-containing protein [Actinomycetes bacterium]
MANQDWFDRDFYKVLGVGKDVTEAELKKVYRQLARQFHPDSNPGDAKAEAKFKEISEAYSVLSDPSQRKEYDMVQAMGGGARFTSGGQPGTSAGFEDLFSNLFGGNAGASSGGSRGFSGGNMPPGFEDMFAGGGFGGGRARAPQRGADLTANTALNFIDAIHGETIKLRVENQEPITVRIPAGVRDGQKIKVRGKGRPSPNSGEPGDLIVKVKVKGHSVFTRDGANLRVTVPVSFIEAALGGTIAVPTLGGEPVKLRLAPGTPNGRVLRVPGKGVKGTRTTGDLLATIEVVVPATLTDKAKSLIEELAEELPPVDLREDLMKKATEL